MALNFKLPLDLDEAPSAPTSFESQMQDLLRSDGRMHRPVASIEADFNSAGSIIQQMSAVSAQQIEGAIEGLGGMRAALLEEAERVHKELAAYSSISGSALHSAREVRDRLADWDRPAAPKVRVAAR